MSRLVRYLKKLISGDNSPVFVQKDDSNYLNSYADYVDKRVVWNPYEAVGGKWDEIGTLQFEFLKSHGLTPNDDLLDIGCGTLRGGRFYIAYLNRSKYTGFDISAEAIKFARQYAMSEFSSKSPNLFQTMNGLTSVELKDRKFDFILAQSVFTHLGPDLISSYFKSVRMLMHSSSKFFFTYDESDTMKTEREVDFMYPKVFFQDLAKSNGLVLTDLRQEYNHPRDQVMLCVTCPQDTF